MVHVMSEVKLYRADWRHVVQTVEDDAQYVGINDYKNKCHSSDTYYRAWKHTEQELDAQRLRADTAEAELKKALELLSFSYQLLGLNNSLVSYRQHMADIGEFISIQKGQFVPRCPNCGYTEQDCREQMDHHLCGFPEPARAALNPKPEAGSHE